MATSVQMKNDTTGLSKEGFYGYSWTTLFFGPLVPLFRADFLTFLGYVIIVFIISLMTSGIGGFFTFIIWSFFYNNFYTKKLLDRGYKFNGNTDENKLASTALGVDFTKSSITTNTKDKKIQASSGNINENQFFDSETDITNEKYKLYLVTKFDITKNNVLEKFIVRGEIFNTLDDALAYSKNIDDTDYENNILLKKSIDEENNKSPEYGAITGLIGPGEMYKYIEYRSGLVKVSHTSGFNKEFPSIAEAKKYFEN